MSPIQVNATLLQVLTASKGAGTVDDWDAPSSTPDPDAGGTLRWQGEAPAYYQEKVQRGASAAGAEVSFVRILFVDTAVARAAAVSINDEVVFRDRTGATVRAGVAVVAMSDLDEIPPELRTTRLELRST